MITKKRIVTSLAFAASLFCFPAFAQKDISIGAVQGDKNVSPYENESVRVMGVVTARTRTGFFVQTPDDKVDNNPATSEGIFVFTKTEPPGEAAIGNIVSVTGTVEEFRPRSEQASLPVTEVSMRKDRDEIRVVSKSNPLPKAVVLTAADFKSNALDQLEKYEGMRVAVDAMTVVGPTDGRVDIKTASAQSNGTFFGVVKGTPRPFREPGMDLYDYVFLGAKEKDKFKADYPKMALFDDNPERIRVESTAQLGSQAIDVPAYAEIKGLSGVLHYSYRTYTLFVDADSKLTVQTTVKVNPLPSATDRQFSIAGMNLENFFDDQDDPDIKEDILTVEAFQRRLKKVSAAIRDLMKMPDVIGTVEVENLATLKRLAERINADAVASGKPDPKYDAYLVEGNDGRGIDVGFLVKSSRVKAVEVKQFGKDDKFKNPNTGEDNFLNDRPPLMLRAAISDRKTNQPFEVTVVVNHLKSFLGYNDPKQQDNVRMKKRLQAEFLARWVNDRQKANPNERIILLGDFNAFQFNDGIVDVVGTIEGKPAPKGEVLNPSDDLVNPDLADLVDSISQNSRYSYSFDGNAQAIDHIIVNEPMKRHIVGFGYARVNADQPEVFRNDENRPERYSDHDPAVAYFTFDAKP
jgi:predicted extracellular nuclease